MEINLDHLRHNVKALQRLLPHNCDIMAVVKANAYGHGDIAIANELCKIGVRAFAVATVSEGIRLRQNGIKGDILVMGYSHPDELPQLIRYRLIQTVIDEDYARVLNECGKTIRVHVKIDTGMARLGEAYDNISALRSVYTCQHLSVEGIYTHLAVSDSLAPDDVAFTRRQLRRFHGAVEQIRKMGFDPGKMHVQSSYGVLNDAREESYDLARIGIAMYGVLSRPGERTKHSVDLRPVLALKARVAAVKELEAGNAVGYGRAFVARRPTRIAVLAIGYADGIPRSLSGIGAVLIHGKRAPIVGLICMDQMMVDVTEIAETRAGDVVTLIGQDGAEEISAEQMAAAAGTITNEWLSRLGSRLERVTV
jgi:serine/alanine racemase